MFGYYIQLGLRSLRRNPVLTLLMVLGIGLGIAASMTTLTVMHLMGADPIPWKSDKLHYVQLDNWDVNNAYYDDGRPPDQVTYRDATGADGGRQGRQAGRDVEDRAADPAGESGGQAVQFARPRDVRRFLRDVRAAVRVRRSVGPQAGRRARARRSC